MQKGGACGALPAGATGPRKHRGRGVSCSVGSAHSRLPGGTPELAVGFRWAGWLATVAAGYRGRSPTHTHTMPPLNPSRWHRRPPPLHNASHPVSETLVSARTHENKGKQKPRESSHI